MDELLTLVETKVGEQVGLLSAMLAGLISAAGLWLWTQNAESIVISSLISGLPVCF